MKPFSILDRDFKVNSPYFVEASAGTGKTFCIEHLVVRLILSGEATIDRILVVTFTRAATRELRTRIRETLRRALSQLDAQDSKAPDYLAAVMGDETARFRLSLALSAIGDAKIFTIHAFCYEMLLQHAVLNLQGLDNGLSHEEKLGVMRDFFRVGLTPDRYGPAQLQRALGQAKGNAEELARLVLRHLPNRRPGTPYSEHKAAFEKWMAETSLTGEKILAHFEQVAPIYTGIADRSGAVKPEVLDNVKRFAEAFKNPDDFDALLIGELVFLDKIAKGKLKKGKEAPPLLPLDGLFSIVEEARDPKNILARMAFDANQMLEKVMEERDILTFDGILDAMAKSVDNSVFVEAVRSQFDAAIVDEFQDTDPIQWKIFERLFAQRDDFPLVVVGDPKQSIYAFRNADIYSYIHALDVLGEEKRRTLAVNYRSRPGLIKALNALFTTFDLPKLGTVLPYHPVDAGVAEDNELSLQDAVQFLRTESEDQTFNFIANEIIRLQKPLSHFAILIKDRYQGERLQAFLKQRGIAALSGRGKLFRESKDFRPLYDLFRASIDPYDRGRATIALGGPLIGLTETELTPEAYINLRASFGGNLLALTQSLAVSNECRQIAAHIAEQRLTPEETDRYFETLAAADEEDDQMPRLFPQFDGEAVTLITTFGSKGLEYGVVFALAMASGTSSRRLDLSSLPEEEREAEKMRLLYVALTRAKDRVYVPVPANGDGTSPVELLSGIIPKPLTDEEPLTLEPAPPPAPLPTPTPPNLAPLTLQSFTSLANPTPHQSRGAPTDFDNPIKTVDTLPAGSEMGILLHELLEGKSPAKPAGWEAVIDEIVDTALNLPLFANATDILREMEFLYPLPDGMMSGVIDLIFKKDDTYHIVDWKSNWLPDYTQPTLQAEMEHHDYFLQAKIYRQALQKYLPNATIGATHYIFLRGLPKGQGIFHVESNRGSSASM